MTLKKPITGEKAIQLRVWFTTSGESFSVPYFKRTRYEQRYIKVPGHLAGDSEPMSISTDDGETFEP